MEHMADLEAGHQTMVDVALQQEAVDIQEEVDQAVILFKVVAVVHTLKDHLEKRLLLPSQAAARVCQQIQALMEVDSLD